MEGWIPDFVSQHREKRWALVNTGRNEIIWSANLMQKGNFINVFLARHVSGTYAHHQENQTLSAATSAPHKRPTQRLSRPPLFEKLGAENHMLQLNVWCSWWWACVPEICRARNTLIKLPCCIKLAFHIISWGRCTVKQPSSFTGRNSLVLI